MTNVRELMTSPSVAVERHTPVREVARLLLEQGLSGVPVTDAEGVLLGVVTAGDIVAKHAQFHLPRYLGILGTMIPLDQRRTDEELRHILAVNAGDLMQEHVVSVGLDDSIEQAASLMVEDASAIMPVVQGKHLVGVIDQRDIIRLVMVEEEDGEHQSVD